MSKPQITALAPTRVMLLAMLGELADTAFRLNGSEPARIMFTKMVGKIRQDIASWPMEEFTMADGIIWVLLAKRPIAAGMPLLASSFEVADSYVRGVINLENDRRLITTTCIQGVTIWYANGEEQFSVMEEAMVG